MKYLFLIVALLSSQQILASDQVLFDCRTTKVYNSLLEESLSVAEYPEVTLIQTAEDLELTLGANNYSEVDGDEFEILPTVSGEKAYRINPATGAEPLVIRISKLTRKGTVYFVVNDKQGNERLVRLARLKCQN